MMARNLVYFKSNIIPPALHGCSNITIAEDTILVYPQDSMSTMETVLFAFTYTKPHNLLDWLDNPDKYFIINPLEYDFTFQKMQEIFYWCADNDLNVELHSFNIVRNFLTNFNDEMMSILYLKTRDNYLAVKMAWL